MFHHDPDAPEPAITPAWLPALSALLMLLTIGGLTTWLVLRFDAFGPGVGDMIVFRPSGADGESWQLRVNAVAAEGGRVHLAAAQDGEGRGATVPGGNVPARLVAGGVVPVGIVSVGVVPAEMDRDGSAAGTVVRDGVVRAEGERAASCVFDPNVMAAHGGSLIIEARETTRPPRFQLHWAGGRTATGTADCGPAADLVLDRYDLQRLANAAGGFGVRPTSLR